MTNINFENHKLSLVVQLLLCSFIFILVSHCVQDNYEKGADIELENFKYAKIQLFDPMLLSLVQQTERSNHIIIKKDPFRPPEIQSSYDMNDVNTSITEDNLVAFALDSLIMVGSIQHNSQWWGLLKAPDNVIHTISVGQLLDHGFYLVTEISADEIYLLNVHTKPFNHSTQVEVLTLNNSKD